MPECDDSHAPWEPLRTVPVLNVSANGVEWVGGFERAWRAASGARPNAAPEP